MSESVRNVSFPMFELMGPSCEAAGCNGVLVDHIDLKNEGLLSPMLGM